MKSPPHLIERYYLNGNPGIAKGIMCALLEVKWQKTVYYIASTYLNGLPCSLDVGHTNNNIFQKPERRLNWVKTR